MKIKEVAKSKMRNDEHFQFNTEFIDWVNKNEGVRLKIQEPFEKYLSFYAQTDEALKKILKSALTAEIQAADKRRDTVFRGLVDKSRAAEKHFRAEVQQAAKRLKILFDTYGNLAKRPLNEQTSGVFNLLQELNGRYAADVQTVGIEEWATELQESNDAFAQLYRARFEESAQQTDVVLRTARTELDKAHRIIIERINALVVVEGEEQYKEFIAYWNTVVAKYAAIMAKRKKGKV